MSRLQHVRWFLLALIGLLPWLALLAAGGFWLWEQQYYREWLWGLLSCSGIAWVSSRYLHKKQTAGYQTAYSLPMGTVLSPRDQSILAEVRVLAESYCERETLPLDRLEGWLAMARDVIGKVARHYKPDASHPELDIPVTWVFLICEKVLHDLRLTMIEKIPGSHIITIQDGLNLSRWYDRFTDAAVFIRLIRFLTNPLGGVLTELSNVLIGKASGQTLQHFQKAATFYFINRVGLYAVELYSGRLIVDDTGFQSSTCAPSGKPPAPCPPAAPEPLRLLVCGQKKAGKSTLVNTLCDTLCAPVDCIPCTAEIEGYRLCREGLLESVILDSPGYGEERSWLQEGEGELDTVDLILLVTPGSGAARQADWKFLKSVREYFAARPQRIPPPIVVAVTKIDQLRPPQEWQPPYPIAPPETLKARNIRGAMDEIVKDLALSEETPIVPVCVTEGYNIDALWLAIAAQLPEAQQANLLRCHANSLTRDKYDQLIRQLRQGSRWVMNRVKAGLP